MSIFGKPVSLINSTDLQDLLQERAVENVRLEFKSEVPNIHWLALLLHASFRPHLTVTPLRFAITSPLSGCEEDFHLPAVDHARRTKKKGRRFRASPF